MEELKDIIPEMTESETAEAENSFYRWLKDSPNNFSFWFPKVKDCGIPSPRSIIVNVPKDIVECMFLERPGDDDKISEFIKNTVLPKIPEDMHELFVKNGCFSNKFDFRWCRPRRSLHSLVLSFEHINYESLCYDTCGNAEFIIRDFIGWRDNDYPYRIYNGMTLRPEIRVFYDFDRKKVLYSANYWDKDYCEEAICRDANDEIIYHAAYPAIEKFVNEHSKEAEALVDEKFKSVEGFKGIWSIDLMWAENKFWLIDMAIGPMSAYWDPKKIK